MSAVVLSGDVKQQDEQKKSQIDTQQINQFSQNQTKENQSSQSTSQYIRIDRSEYCYFACGNRQFSPEQGYVKSTPELDEFYNNRIMPDEFCKLETRQRQKHIAKSIRQFEKLKIQIGRHFPPHIKFVALINHMDIELRLKSTLHRFLAGDKTALNDIKSLKLQALSSKQLFYWPNALNKEIETVMSSRTLVEVPVEDLEHTATVKSETATSQDSDFISAASSQSSKHRASSRVPPEHRHRFSRRPQPLILSGGVGAGSAGSAGAAASVGAGSKSASVPATVAPSSAGAKRVRSSLKSTRFPQIGGAQFSPQTPSPQQGLVSALLKSSPPPRSQSATALSRMDKEPKSPATNDTAAGVERSGAKSRMGYRS